MLLSNLFDFTVIAYLIDFAGGLIIVWYAIATAITLLRGGTITQARLLMANGALAGLNFKVAGTLLKTIVVHTWAQILMFVAIFALRTILKWVFTWNRADLQRYRRELSLLDKR